MKSPIKYHGGKNYLANKIVELMPPHLHFVEPYAGGLSVLLAKDPQGVSEVVNDLNKSLTTFWAVLQSEKLFPMFQRVIQATPFSEREYAYSHHRITSGTPRIISNEEAVGRAVDFFITCRQSLAGRMDSFAPLSRNRVRRGMNEQASAWLAAIEGLPAVHARLKRVIVLNRNALDVIRQQDGENTLFYLDPPYLTSTRVSTEVYEHEMTREQHVELLDTLADPALKSRWMLSGYRSDLYDEYAARHKWNRHDFLIANHASGKAEKTKVTESLWCNF